MLSTFVSSVLPNLVTTAYLAVLFCLAVYGVHRSHLVWLYFRNRKTPEPQARFLQRPVVTIQLPLYNEMYVVERLLDAVAQIRWPRERLEIQVLDDSTDETVDIARRKVAALRALGLDAKYIHRADRTGFKAGALDHGLKTARGEYVLIFDADFVPEPDVLERTMDHFTDPKVAVVQARWEHVNRNYNLLTETQALMLDGHFVLEHGARCRAGLFFNFNGTAGIWRRSAIDDAGGWQHDTLTEDMDLSYRAQLKGWRFVYVPDVAAPAELPVEMNAFKSQQFRWAKGSLQVARKLLPTILRADLPRAQKIEAFFHLTNNLAYPLLVALCALLLPNLIFRTKHGIREVLMIDLPLFFGTTLSIASFYVASQRELGRGAWSALRRLPMLMALGIGLSINQARAAIEALAGRESEFVRTPKHGVCGKLEQWTEKKYKGMKTLVPWVELGFALYFVAAIAVAVRGKHYITVPFLVLFVAGFGTVSLGSLLSGRLAGWRSRRPDAPPATPVLVPANENAELSYAELPTGT